MDIPHFIYSFKGLPQQLSVKESAHGVGDMRSIPRLGRSPGIGNGIPFQYSCLNNSMDRGAWQASVNRVAKSRTQLTDWIHIYPFISWWAFVLFLHLSIVYKVAMNTHAQVFKWMYVFISLEFILSRGTARSYGNSTVNIFETCRLFFKLAAHFTFLPAMDEGFNFSTSSTILAVICLLYYSHPRISLIFISLIATWGALKKKKTTQHWFPIYTLSILVGYSPWGHKESDMTAPYFLSIPWPIKSEYLIMGPRKLVFVSKSLECLRRFMFKNLLGLVLVKVPQRNITNRR